MVNFGVHLSMGIENCRVLGTEGGRVGRRENAVCPTKLNDVEGIW